MSQPRFRYPTVVAVALAVGGVVAGSPSPSPGAEAVEGREAVALPEAAAGIDVHDTRMLTQPAVSEDHVAFVYANDLWVVDIEGGPARRLTSHVGDESSPRFSPDGRTVAFSGEYDGNTDVFTVPVEGGIPERLTWHPFSDTVVDFAPDGSSVLFRSARAVHTGRYQKLYTVTPGGGMPEELPIPHAYHAAYSPDGSHIAYTPLSEPFREWKNYRGGRVSRIWIYDVGSHAVEQVPQPEGRCNDTEPMWVGDALYFLSDRNGEFNLFSYRPSGFDGEFGVGTGEMRQLTFHEDFPVLHASAGGGRIVYEQAGYLHLFSPGEGGEARGSSVAQGSSAAEGSPTGETVGGTSARLTIGVVADLVEARPRWESGPGFIRDAGISPTGKRAVFEYRGEVVTVPAEKGSHRNLTESPAVHDRSPAWSPDGSSVAWFSDASGEYELHIGSQDGQGEVRTFAIDGAGFYEDPRWSPDGTKISFTDNSWSLYVIDVETGDLTEVAQEPVYGPDKSLHHAWSPDSRWIAYTLKTETNFQRLHLYSLDSGRSHLVTEGLADATEPVFDASGKYLYFAASTDAGPVRTWFAMSNADMQPSNTLYLAVLEEGVESPLAPESDEEPVDGDAEEDGEDEEDDEDRDDGEAPRTVVDVDGLDQRIVSLPVADGYHVGLQAGGEGELYYLRRSGGAGPFGFGGTATVVRFSLEERKEETLAKEVRGFALSRDGKKMLVALGDAWLIADAGKEVDPSKGRLSTGELKVKVDPRAEWAQIYDEAWRINRDYFYDPGFHGVDWDAMRDRYAQFLPHVATRDDLGRVIEWLGSELAVGHHYSGGGDSRDEPERVPGGLLGADYEVADGRYRFATVYGGLNWNPDLRAPLTEPGVDVKEGEYLLAVNGVEVRPPDNLYRHFENTAGEIVEITVGPSPDGTGSRTVQVVPVESELALRNRAWVEGNLEAVDRATDGRVAYVYVPNTAGAGHVYFKRYFFPQADREALIVDERYNGGGQIADYYIDLLRRPYVAHWNTRYGKDLETPVGAIQGPKVMLIDETAGSGGDLLPWMFRKFGLGQLIGRRTWGGLVGILGFPVLMDGGSVTAPNLAIWTPDGGWVVENEGVPPDIEVEQVPARVIEGHDPQLERAIEEIMSQLPPEPPAAPQPPPYPERARRQERR